MPRVSVAMPVYNGERFLRQAVDSLLAQTFRDFEFVIVDNCSTDGTEAICREVISLPMSAETSEREVASVVEAVRSFFHQST